MGFYGLFCTTISMIWKQLVTNILYFWMRKKNIIKNETQNKMNKPILILKKCVGKRWVDKFQEPLYDKGIISEKNHLTGQEDIKIIIKIV